MEKKTYKVVLVVIAVSLFVLSIPFSFQNASDYEALEKTLNDGYKTFDCQQTGRH
jgi:hypothetical protein